MVLPALTRPRMLHERDLCIVCCALLSFQELHRKSPSVFISTQRPLDYELNFESKMCSPPMKKPSEAYE